LTPLSATAQLTSALQAVAAALAAADTAALLAGEESLSWALAEVSRVRSVDGSERHAVARELAHARATLERCRVLGQSAADATHATLVAIGRRSADYRRGGTDATDPADVAVRGLGLERSM
jgi:predicted exporter